MEVSRYHVRVLHFALYVEPFCHLYICERAAVWVARRSATMVFGLAFVTGRRPNSAMIDDPCLRNSPRYADVPF